MNPTTEAPTWSAALWLAYTARDRGKARRAWGGGGAKRGRTRAAPSTSAGPKPPPGAGEGARGPGRAPPRRSTDAQPARQEDRPGDDPAGVQDRRERVEKEPAVGDEDLAEDERRREEQLGEARQPEEPDVLASGRRIEVRRDDLDGQGGQHDEDQGQRPHDEGRHRQGRLARAGR